MGIRTERHKARELATDTLYSLDFNSNLPPTGDFRGFQKKRKLRLQKIPKSMLPF